MSKKLVKKKDRVSDLETETKRLSKYTDSVLTDNSRLHRELSKLSIETKRKLTEKEIEYILDFIQPNPYIPITIALSVQHKNKKQLQTQLQEIEIYPSCISTLKSIMHDMYLTTLIEPGESVGIITAQSIGESQ